MYYIRTKTELDSGLGQIQNKDHYMVDCETSGLVPQIDELLLLQVGTDDIQLVIDVHAVGKSNLNTVRQTIGDSTIVGHNIKFDLKFLKVHLGWDFSDIYDTMIADKIIYAGYPMSYRFGLKHTLWRHLKVKVDKDTRKEFIGAEVGAGFSDEAIEYSGLDVKYLLQVMRVQEKLVNRMSLQSVLQLELATLCPLARVELNGFRLDVEGWRDLIVDAEREAEEIRAELNETVRHLTDGEINWNSPKQVVTVINEFQDEVTIESSAKDVLENISHIPLVSRLLEYRKKSKFVSSFGEKLLEKLVNGRLHTHYGLVATGRMSSSDPNMQQMPSTDAVRSKFVADEGCKLITADYGSQELVILASNSKEPAWIKALQTGQDLHSISASMLYRDKWTKATEEGCRFKDGGYKCSCKEHMKMRNAAKAISFSLAYGAGARALSGNLSITEREAEELMDSFFAALPNVHDYLESMGKFANDYAYSVTNAPIKRRRFFPWFSGLSWGAINRRGKNSVIQGTAADQTKLALVNIDYRIQSEGWDAKILAIVHDEIVCQCVTEQAEEFAEKVVKTEMELAGQVTLKNKLLKTKPNISDVWSK